MKLKKDSLPFAAGMATMMLLIGLVTGSLATEGNEGPIYVHTVEHPAGKITAQSVGKVYRDQAGVALFGVEQVAPGTARTTSKGAEVPTVLTYVDEKGMANYYISAETVAEVLDVAYGVTWNEQLKCVDFGTEIMTMDGTSARYTGEPAYPHHSTTVNGREVISVGNEPSIYEMGEISVTIGGGDLGLDTMPPEMRAEEEARIKARNEKLRANTPLTPEYGVTRGALTEVSPDKVDQGSYMGSFMNKDVFQSQADVGHTFYFAPVAGSYAAVTVENPGTEDVLVQMARPRTVGEDFGTDCNFTRVRIPAGKSLTRYFRLEDAANLALQSRLSLEARTLGGGEVQIKLSAEQYRSGTAQK